MPQRPKLERDSSDSPDTDDGLINDEYTDPSFEEVDELDALDVPSALLDERVLEDVADDSYGIEEVDVQSVDNMMDTIDTGARRSTGDDADMGLGAEPHTADELQDAAIGHALRGPGAVTRDDELHGDRFLDSPDDEETE